MAEISIKAESLFHIGVFNFTNSYLLSLIVTGIFVSLAFWLKNQFAMIPGKIQSIFELLTEQILQLMDNILGSRKLSEKYFPIVATIFLFILLSNWMGLLPGAGSLGIKHEMEHVAPITAEHLSETSIEDAGHGQVINEETAHTDETKHETVLIPFLRAPGADLNFTVALAVIALIAVNFFGLTALGFKQHMSKFFNFKNPIYTFVGFLELISEFVKIISFSFRLFGNVFAGEVLLIIIGFLGPYFLPLPFLFLEVFVGFIQAFIFAMLTLVFIGTAVSHESHA